MTPSQTSDLTRREMLGGVAAAAVGLSIAPPAFGAALAADAPAGVVAGVVFEDRSSSRTRRPGDPGVPGVMVSNGRDVAITDDEGRYTLPIYDESVIFVVKPTGYAVPVDAHNLPQFHYLHQPDGSPGDLGLRFAGVAPTGPLPPSVDFALVRQDEATRFDVILLTDPQPETGVELEFVRDAVVDGLIGTRAAFGVTCGDLMFDDLSLYDRYNRIVAQIGCPWYSIGGNHDLNFEAPGRRYSRETFKRVFGPPAYAFQHGGATFIMLDNVEYLGADPANPRRSGKYEGRIDARQLEWLARTLAHVPTDQLVVIAMHIPLSTYLDEKDPAVNTTNRGDLFKLLAGRPHTVSFAGHTHTTEHHYFGSADGFDAANPHHHHVLTAASGSWWSGPFDRRGIAVADSRDGSPNGCHILSVDGSAYATRFVPASEPGGRQMRICLDGAFHGSDREVLRDFRMGQLLGSPITVEQVFATAVVVNVFDGGPKTRVEYTVGGHAPLAMERVTRPDPFVAEVYARNEATKKPWVRAEPSSHIWQARLPRDLGPGTHTVAVRAVDQYGREHRDSLVVEILA